jgi:hypothetical protein
MTPQVLRLPLYRSADHRSAHDSEIMTVEAQTTKKAFWDLPERIALGLAAGSALIAAACIGGLPSASSCFALVETYARAVDVFGGVSLGAIVGLLMLAWMRQASQREAVGTRRVMYVFLIAVSYVFVMGALSARHNLVTASKHCFEGH